MRRIAALALAVATVGGCTLSTNNARGLAAVGGATAIAGTLVVFDGMQCDEASQPNATCTRDDGELTRGAVVATVGLAMMAFGLWHLTHDPDDEAPAKPARTSAR